MCDVCTAAAGADNSVGAAPGGGGGGGGGSGSSAALGKQQQQQQQQQQQEQRIVATEEVKNLVRILRQCASTDTKVTLLQAVTHWRNGGSKVMPAGHSLPSLSKNRAFSAGRCF
jgi:hypothetical protein